ncbi:MAG TPA: hypothetical protein PKK99_16045, partial [Bacteroidia bacterium]|nr:hypothetical protein [Bacteroidia bacterium]
MNFRENSGNSETSRKEQITEKTIRKYGFRIMGPKAFRSCFNINGNDTTKSVFAGVGSPINEVLCLVSMLNFASLRAEKTVITNGKNCRICLKLLDSMIVDKLDICNNLNTINPGTNPKLTASANESSSFPIGEVT